MTASTFDSADGWQRTQPPAHAGELEDIVLQDHEGEDQRLGELWQDRPAVLVFLRHWGCTFCRHHAVQLYRDRDKFDDAGVRLVVIGQGTPEQAARFRKAQTVDLPLLVDPDRRSYRAAGAKLGTFSEVFGFRVLAKGLARVITSRIRGGSIVVNPGRLMNDRAQLGGVLVVTPDGSVRYAHMSEDASDTPPNAEVLAAVLATRPHIRTPVPV